MTNYHKKPVASPQIVRDFLSYMIGIKNKSANTTYEYSVDLRSFFTYVLNQKQNNTDSSAGHNEESATEFAEYQRLSIEEIRSIDRIDIADYLYYLSNKGLSAPTRARKLAAIRAFFDYLCYKTYRLEDNPCEMVESPAFKRKLPVFLTETECIYLLECIHKSLDKNMARDYCIITFFMLCGLRIDELVGINLGDIRHNLEDNQESLILVVTGKGNKQRTIYLPQLCVNAYHEYIHKRIQPKDDKEKALFISQKGQRMSHRAIERMVKKYFAMAGLDASRLTPHKLRHTAATNMLNANTDIRVIQQALGHETLQTTQIYTHVSNASLKDAFMNNSLSQIMENGKKDEE